MKREMWLSYLLCGLIFALGNSSTSAQDIILKDLGNSAASSSGGVVGDSLIWGGSIWDISTMFSSSNHILPTPSGLVAFSHDQSFLVGTSGDSVLAPLPSEHFRLAVLDLKTGGKIRDIPYRDVSDSSIQPLFFDGVKYFQISADDRRLLVSWNGVQVWDLVSGKKLWKLPQGLASFSPDSQRILLVSSEKATMYRYSDGARVCEVSFIPNRFSPIGMFSPEGKKFLTINNGNLDVWDSSDCRNELSIKTTKSYFTQAMFSKNGKEIVVGDGSPAQIEIRNASSGQLIQVINQVDAKVIEDFSTDATGSRLLVKWSRRGSIGGEISLWDIDAGMELRRFRADAPLPEQNISYGIGFSGDGNRIALIKIGSADPPVLWNAKTGQLISWIHHGND